MLPLLDNKERLAILHLHLDNNVRQELAVKALEKEEEIRRNGPSYQIRTRKRFAVNPHVRELL
jgi:hypothetical protein